jgi:predicted AAA+ superfamily ATPase
METPFIFGHIAENQYFIGYKDETEALVSSFISSRNVVVAGTRKCGKSSLIEKASNIAVSRCQELKICRISLSTARDEHTFFSLLAQEMILQSHLIFPWNQNEPWS